MRALLALAALLLSACSTTQAVRPEPIIRTVEVKVPVAVPCPALEKLGPEPQYPDSDEALRSAPDILEQVKLLLAGRALRAVRAAAVAEALAICAAHEESAPAK